MSPSVGGAHCVEADGRIAIFRASGNMKKTRRLLEIILPLLLGAGIYRASLHAPTGPDRPRAA